MRNNQILGKITLCLFFFLISCKKDAEPIQVPRSFEVSDPTFRMVKEWEDKRENSAILEFLMSGTALEKFWAIRAISSTQDSGSIGILIKILNEDQPLEVKLEAAYSLGQIRIKVPPSQELHQLVTKNDPSVQLLLLEAIGKIGSIEDLGYLSSFDPGTDTLLITGKMLGLYRMGLRNIISEKSIRIVVEGLTKRNSKFGRQVNANYLARVRAEDIMDHQEILVELLKNDNDPMVRMNIATALAAGKGNSSRDALISSALNDPDFRVRVNALTSLRLGGHSLDHDLVGRIGKMKTLNEKLACSEWVEKLGKDEDKGILDGLLSEIEHWRLRINFIKAILRLSSKGEKKEILDRFKDELLSFENDFALSYGLSVFSDFPDEHEFIFQFVRDPSKGVVVNSGAMGALYGMIRSENFSKEFLEGEYSNMLGVFFQYFKYGILSGDPTLIGYGARGIRIEEIDWSPYYDDLGFLETAKSNLDLPNESETLIELERTIAALTGLEYKYPKIKFTHPPDWKEIEENFRYKSAMVNTNKGAFSMVFDWEGAPLSVSNFISLAKGGSYDGTRFHRVENNFVVQGGCPRGDGWGGPGYSIRSEFSRRYYQTGSVGMASAGKDTEGSQWFVTHYPSNHLDGKYTNFGLVDDMSIVYQLEVGDTLHSIELME